MKQINAVPSVFSYMLSPYFCANFSWWLSPCKKTKIMYHILLPKILMIKEFCNLIGHEHFDP